MKKCRFSSKDARTSTQLISFDREYIFKTKKSTLQKERRNMKRGCMQIKSPFEILGITN